MVSLTPVKSSSFVFKDNRDIFVEHLIDWNLYRASESTGGVVKCIIYLFQYKLTSSYIVVD